MKEDRHRGPSVVLALETATDCGGIALVSEESCLAEYSLRSSLTHSRRLLTGIARLLADTGLAWTEIGAVAVSMGPGSFTGLRIGLSTAKGLAMAAAKPLIGVGTLDGLAWQVSAVEGLVCPVLDARKKQVYAALYRRGPDGEPVRRSPWLAVEPDRLCEMVHEPVLLLGDGVQVYRRLFVERLGGLAGFAPEEICFPRAAAIGGLALEKLRRGEFLDAASAIPCYVRPSEAELHFPEARSRTLSRLRTGRVDSRG